MKTSRLLKLNILKGEVLGVPVYRGFARLCDLARMSKADVYDQRLNPTGTQRDLNPKHAREAYLYVKDRALAFWPEVFLSVRDPSIANFKAKSSRPDYGVLSIKIAEVESRKDVVISRVDGNHRLHFADGKTAEYPPLERVVSFCLAYGLTRKQEIVLFRDINDNQKAMNTSHLDNIEVRLTREDTLKKKSPDLYIAQKLGRDDKSPFYNLVYEGGKRPVGVDLPLRSLRSGISYMLSRSSQLPLLSDTDVQYRLIRNYFHAVKKWEPKAWKEQKEHLILRGAGFWAVCFVGASVIDRALTQDKYKASDMLSILKSGKSWDWSREGDFKGYSGRSGALEISKKISGQFYDKERLSSAELYKKIMQDDE